MNNLDLPQRINVIRTLSFDVPAIIEGLREVGWSDEDITEETVLEYIEDCVDEDMRSAPSRHDIVWQDENGEEL
jgi:hypothetical protein